MLHEITKWFGKTFIYSHVARIIYSYIYFILNTDLISGKHVEEIKTSCLKKYAKETLGIGILLLLSPLI